MIRNGKRMEIGVEEVVPGDIVHVEVVSPGVWLGLSQANSLCLRAPSFPLTELLSRKTPTFKSTSPQSRENLWLLTNKRKMSASVLLPSNAEVPLWLSRPREITPLWEGRLHL